MTDQPLQTAADLEDAFLKWNELLYRYAYARLRSHELAQDVTQETFTKGWQHRDTFEPEKSSLKNWLFVILINTMRDHFRNQKNQVDLELAEDVSSDTNIAAEVGDRSALEFVLKQIHTLPERDQEVLLLRYTEDLPLQEISSVLQLSYNATKVCLHRALQKLRTKCQTV